MPDKRRQDILRHSRRRISKTDGGFEVDTEEEMIRARAVVIATGGLSIPKIGATGFGYAVAEQFGMTVIPPRPALVPLTFTDALKDFCNELSGLSVDAVVACGKARFAEGLPFSHRGLTGPSILQISSHWQEGADQYDLPRVAVAEGLNDAKITAPKQEIQTWLGQHLPKRLASTPASFMKPADGWRKAATRPSLPSGRRSTPAVKPAGTEGYRTAEVTLGGVDTNQLSSTDMQSKTCPGLYFIGEVVMTGHLGGHNFQWAWASAVATRLPDFT